MYGVSVASLITALVSGIISSALTYFSTRSRIRLDMRVEYDKNLHDKRLDLYKRLWPKTRALARYTADFDLTYEIVREAANEMRDWYFDEGGIYLSKRSRKPYFLLKELMQDIIDDKKLEQEQTKAIGNPRAPAILAAAHRLRTSLADDIRTRRAPWL